MNAIPQSDLWSDWLLHHRHGGDAVAAAAVRAETELLADRVLDAAAIKDGMTLLDVGSGDGLIALRAIERVGPSLRVILTDISAPMLAHVREMAAQRGVLAQCSFLEGSAERLAGVADAAVDVVVTRAVLAYVADKPAAFREFFRVLKPAGRMSLCEPVMRDEALGVCMLKQLLAAQPADRLLALQCRIMAAQYPQTMEAIAASALTNYTERDLVHFAHGAGFNQVHMALHIDLKPSAQTNWTTFLESAPHPLAPTVSAILAGQFTAGERAYFEEHFRPVIESGSSVVTSRNAYLTAGKA